MKDTKVLINKFCYIYFFLTECERRYAEPSYLDLTEPDGTLEDNRRKIYALTQSHIKHLFTIGRITLTEDNRTIVIPSQQSLGRTDSSSDVVYVSPFQEYVPVPPVWCCECRIEYTSVCPHHGSFLIEEPSKEYVESISTSSEIVSPYPLYVEASSICLGRQGVWTNLDLPGNLLFGPYGGELKSCVGDFPERDQHYDFLRALHLVFTKSFSTWMHHVSSSPIRYYCNMQCVWIHGSLFFQTTGPITKSSELLVWTGNRVEYEIDLTMCFYNPHLTCFKCYHQLSSEDHLNSHLLTCSGVHNAVHLEDSNSYICSYCNEEYPTRDQHLAHVCKHENSTAVRCKICSRKFLYPNLSEHYSRHHPRDLIYDSNIEQNRLLSDTTLSSNTENMNHSSLEKDSFSDLSMSDVEIKMITMEDLEEGRYPFLEYLKESTQPEAVEEVKIEALECKRDVAEKIRSNPSLRKTEYQGPSAKHCNICGKAFAPTTSLRLHMTSHTGTRDFKCKFCPQKFAFKSTLRRHEKVHTGEKPFKCSLCNNSYSQSSNLNRHMQQHLNQKPYSCLFCPKSFTQRFYLRRHFLVHFSKDKSTVCSICQKKENSLSDLTFHMESHCYIKT